MCDGDSAAGVGPESLSNESLICNYESIGELHTSLMACCTRGSARILQFAPRAHSTATLSVRDGPGTRTDMKYDWYSSRDTQPGPHTLSRPAAVQTVIRPRTHAKQRWSGVRPRGGEPGL